MAKHAFKFYADEDIWEWLQSLDSGERSAKINSFLRQSIEPVTVLEPVLSSSSSSSISDRDLQCACKDEIEDLKNEIEELKSDVRDLESWREEISDLSLLRDLDYDDWSALAKFVRSVDVEMSITKMNSGG